MTEGANLIGKSVEMIANAIAEMRTYGEGFIIADQSPGLLDMSIIRNTNTKIVLRLPEYSDRELVGRAAGLNDNQIEELSKLKRGVAAVYQNDWIEAVLCAVNKCKHKSEKYQKTSSFQHENSCIHREIIDLILNDKTDNIEKFKKRVKEADIMSGLKKAVLNYLEDEKNAKKKGRFHIAYMLFNSEDIVKLQETCASPDEFRAIAAEKMVPSIKNYSDKEIDYLITLILAAEADKNAGIRNLFQGYIEYLNKRNKPANKKSIGK